MLQLTVTLNPEGWDPVKEEFVPPKTTTLQLEHSLISLSKWESKWHKAYLTRQQLTNEEQLDYIRCMTLTQNVNPEVYDHLSKKNVDEIRAYIDNPMTATNIYNADGKGKGPGNETVTSELVYYWMIKFGIPSEYQKWHLNRLLTLIRVCEVKETPPKKMSTREIMSRNAALNAERKARLHTKG